MANQHAGIEDRLIVGFRGEEIMEVPLACASIGIGSGEDAGLRLSGPGVERHHVVLRRRGRQWMAIARDLATIGLPGSGRGAEACMCPGYRICVGEYSLEVRPGKEGRGDPSTSPGTETMAEPPAAMDRGRLALRAPPGCRPGLVRVEGAGLVIGRDPGCDIVGRDPYMSLRHARILPAGGRWIVTDLGSRNGTRLDGRLVDGAEIRGGSRLAFGRTVIECLDESELPARPGPGAWLETPGLLAAVEEVDRCATTALPVLITGESGTGKEALARRIHERGARRDGPFVPVNCAALPEGLVDSMLFGHVRGAFTGASEDRDGLVRASSGGTLFLDEVGELSLAQQSRLLRVLEEGAVRPVGSSTCVPVDLRVVAATNRDLAAAVDGGSFRMDLLHRLAVLTVRLPPLRDRRGDIPILARWLAECSEPRAAGISGEALSILEMHAWPGNVREMRNVIDRASLRCGGSVILPCHVDFLPTAAGVRDRLPHSVEAAEALVARSGGNVAAAARLAGVSRSTLRDHLRRLRARPA